MGLGDRTVRRGPFHGAWRVVRYNSHWYALALIVCAASIVLAVTTSSPLARTLGVAVGVISAWWLMASILASYWIYDRARLNDWTWLLEHIAEPRSGNRWLSLDVGSDLGAGALKDMLPGEVGTARTLALPSGGQTRSLSKAQADAPMVRPSRGRSDLDGQRFNRVFLLQAAHELRSREDRERLFEEIAEHVAPEGEVVVVEHGLDIPNLLVWGPGAFHHYPVREWIRLAEQAGLRLHHTGRHTPFVRVLVFSASSGSTGDDGPPGEIECPA